MASTSDTRATVHPVSVRHPSLATITAAATSTSTTDKSQSHNELESESEEMLMMFSTSPDSWANDDSLRHSRLGPHSSLKGKATTTSELAAFSRDPYAISISQLVSDNDNDRHRHSSEYRLNTRYDHPAPIRRDPMRPSFITC